MALNADKEADKLDTMPRGVSVVVAEDTQTALTALAVDDFADRNITLHCDSLKYGGTRISVVYAVGEIDDDGNTVNVRAITPTVTVTKEMLAGFFRQAGLTVLDEKTDPN